MLEMFLNAGYSLPICLFLNVGILAFSPLATAKFAQEQELKPDMSREHSLRRNGASLVIFYTTYSTYM